MIAANTTGGLPDFLSDPAVNSVDARGGGSPALSDDFLYQTNGDLELELRRVCNTIRIESFCNSYPSSQTAVIYLVLHYHLMLRICGKSGFSFYSIYVRKLDVL